MNCKKSSQRLNNSGLTLIEVLIVLALVAGLFAFGLPRMNLGRDNLRTASRELSSLVREIRLQARLQQSTFRLVFDTSNPLETRYWIEKTRGQISPQDMKLQSLEQRAEAAKAREKGTSLDREKPDPFQIDNKILKEPKSMPRGIQLRAIQVQRAQASIPIDSFGSRSATSGAPSNTHDHDSRGLQAIHFSPQGLVELAVIQLQNSREQVWSLVLNPLTGHTTIVTRAVGLDELRSN
jgi:prepilin-type N-terminal cleavage/methylation domain-containing protein